MTNSHRNITFAELYMLDEGIYANKSVKSLPFSTRTVTRLHWAGIITIADLLKTTPAKLMRSPGFGDGCLEEIERELATLNDNQSVEVVAMQTSPSPVLRETSLRESNELTLGEKYGMNPDDFIDMDVQSIPFSTRLSNALLRSNINTVALLLGKTEKQLRALRNFGRTCLTEIDARLQVLCVQTTARTNPTAKVFTAEEHRLIAAGDFSFLVDVDLSDEESTFVARYIEAQDTLGKELALACIDRPLSIISILESLKDFVRKNSWQNELDVILKDIPIFRHNNQAIAYINTFTRHEEERSALIAMYPTADSPLKAIVNAYNINARSVHLAKRFLNWCQFDLREEISQIFSTIYSNERYQQVLTLRAQKKTLDQIGRQFGLTRERIRQLENKIQRAFNWRQSRIKIISKINADKNNATLVTPANVAEYCSENLQELLFLLRGCESSNFTYDKDLDVFIIGDDSIHERAFAFVEKLPELFNVKDVPKFYAEAAEEYDLPAELVDKAIAEGYRLSGEVYYKSRLSLALIYTEIIKEFYPDGIDAYDSETITRFRQLIFEKYGPVKLPENDRALTARIAGICVLCGRGRYRLKQKQYIPKELAKKICDYIEYGDTDIVMTNTLFAVFEGELRKCGVDNKYYLQGIMHELYGDRFTFTRDYISTDPSLTSIYPCIVNYIHNADYPISKEQLMKQFPGLPEIVLNIATSDTEILNFFGNYYHADSIVLSEAEKNYLNTVTKRVISDGGIHHAEEIYDIVNAEKPELFTRNFAMYPFSGFSILEWLFRDQYQFSRPFIAKKGVDITRPAERLHDFVYSKESITVSEISAFIRETRLFVQSLLVFIDECNDKFLLTNSEILQVIEKTGADAAVAAKVETAILSEIHKTTTIRSLQCWNQLPSIKVPWTDWLIYSVLKKWGKHIEVAPSNIQFKLAVPLVAPKGKMDTTPHVEAYKTNVQPTQNSAGAVLDLDNIDDILADILTDETLGGDLWDSET